MHTIPADWNPAEYLAWFLKFNGILPTSLSSNLPDPLKAAVSYIMSNPQPVASHEYMKAMIDTFVTQGPPTGASLLAIDKITPEVSKWALAYWGELRGQQTGGQQSVQQSVQQVIEYDRAELVGFQHVDQFTHYA